MTSLTVTITDVNGTAHQIGGVEDGANLMEIGKANGIAGILGDCGGDCACATCHVYVSDAWLELVGEPGDMEAAMLEMVADVLLESSRLGCQVKMSADLDGLEVTVAPPSNF